MSVDVSRIPNNNKFDPVREAILDLQQQITGGGGSVGTLDDVTTNGNTTTNSITVGGLTSTSDATLNTIEVGIGTGASATNLVVGSSSFTVNSSGVYNTVLGNGSMIANTSGSRNTSLGHAVLTSNTTGNWNVGIGNGSLGVNTTGSFNVGVGVNTLDGVTTNSNNTAIGYEAISLINGSDNTAIGYRAGKLTTGGSSKTGGSDNIYIGSSIISGAASTDNEIVIGYATTGRGSNTVTIGNSSITSNRFYGEISSTDGLFLGRLAVGTISTAVDFQIENALSIPKMRIYRSDTTIHSADGSPIYEIQGYIDTGSGGDKHVSNIKTVTSDTNATNDTGGALVFQTATRTSGIQDRLIIEGDGSIKGQSIYDQTSANAANVVVLSDGELVRSTSSIKYKTDVEAYDKGMEAINSLRPVYYKGLNDGETRFAGLIAEEVHEAGLTEFVQYAEDGTPDALAYQNMVSLLIKGMQELKSEIETLKSQINA